MKKLFISLSILTCVGAATAQTITADVSAKYAYSATGMFNKSISDLGASQDYDVAFSSNYGLAGTFNFGKIGLGVEYLMGNFKAGYQGDQVLIGGAYTSNVELKTTQIPVYLRLGGSKGSFGEFGVVMNNVKSATYTNSNYLIDPSVDVSNQYQNFMGYMVGVGGRFGLLDLPVMVSVSARFMYSTADAKGVDALGTDLDLYNPYNKTNAASVGLHVGVVYSID
ncbi:MAG: hypothetical protein NWS92_00500 [Crocinitomicaceae bacterium]|jgi:hypothetical protein|nr:hypothetical protein [Crocinitomicaceae bacterium]MDP4738559.1 hypothetical protein [Crocinitomicaceae bacterium]MDP4798651.1 hypothetical protein [Crocinitomicaceae bacterium]